MSVRQRVGSEDPRVVAPFLTPREVALLTGMNEGRAYRWARQDLVTTVLPRKRGWPSVPLLGLAEYETFRAWNSAGLPMGEVVAVAHFIRREIDQYGFLSREIVHDGTIAYLQENEDLERLINGQMAFFSVVQERLEPFSLDEDGFVFQYRIEHLPGVVIDPRYNGGRMMFEDSAVPLFAIAGELIAGEPPEVVADDYGISHEQVAAVVENLAWLSEAA